MKVTAVLTFLVLVLASSSSTGRVVPKLSAGESRISLLGASCAACTVIAGMVDQLKEFHKDKTHSDAFKRFCKVLPKPYDGLCGTFRLIFGAQINTLLAKGETPDTVCMTAKLCTPPKDGQPTCHLYPSKLAKQSAPEVRAHMEQLMMEVGTLTKDDPRLDICGIPLIGNLLCSYLNMHAFNLDFPEDDNDADGFSDKKTLRGSNWRGKDCSDGNMNSYPGRKPAYGDNIVDTNCNGISGMDATNGQRAYEDVLCSESEARGIVVLGDSVAANFHVPGQWFNVSLINSDLFVNLTYMMENSLNWPHTSVYTGHENVTWSIIDGKTDSLYWRLRNRNRCNHRDFQNLGVNGATILDANGYAKNLKRDPLKDKPQVIIFSFMGNDVCKYRPDSSADLTSPAQARKGFLDTMETLDEKLPAGSHVVVVGIADARSFFAGIHDQIHPFGSLRKDVTYGDFYNYLTCIDLNPCPGWLTRNEYVHNLTAQLVVDINTVLQQTVTVAQNEGRFKNFDMVYVENPVIDVIKTFEAQGGKGWQLVEAFDGFHPNQKGHALLAAAAWDVVDRKYPHIWGPVNPNNDRIQLLFQEQGGH